MMQYPLYASYPYTNVYPCINNYLSSGCSFGQVYGSNYGYQPWMTPQGNPRMILQQNGRSEVDTPSSLMKNVYYPNCPLYVYPQYSLYHYPWSTPYALTTWFNPQKTYNQMIPWSSYYDKWTPMHTNFNTSMYYSWPMMNYYSNQMMYPSYICPSPIYWGVQHTVEMPYSESNQKKTNHHASSSESTKLNVTSSDVIREFNLPPAVAKKTRSDIPIQSVEFSDIRSSEHSKEEMELPYLFRVSDTSIKQIASSRSFGPSMVYTTESDNKPLSTNW